MYKTNKVIGILTIILVVISCNNSSDKNISMSDSESLIVEKIAIQSVFNQDIEYKTITKKEAIADLDELIQIIHNRHSYIHSVDFDYKKIIENLKLSLPKEIPTPVLALQIQKLIQYMGDSHAWVNGWKELLPKGYSPVKFGFKQKRIFAYWQDASNLMDPDFPYVKSIDGLTVDQWFKLASDISSGSGSSYSTRLLRGRELMEYITFMRNELGIKNNGNVVFELETEDKSLTKTWELPILEERKLIRKPFRLENKSKIIQNDIGYLRIYSQKDPLLLNSLDSIMLAFKETEALIIDTRQCGGGRRSNLQALFPYFMKSNDPPYIPNVAKLRIPKDIEDFDPKGKLDVGDKKLKYIEDDDVTTEELDALSLFLSTFNPKFKTPVNKFTDYYFMAMTAKDDKYFYDNPIYLIIDFGVGSAGDIFVSTFKGWRNVTLVGTPSNGRSGNSIITELRNSKIPVRLSTMVSYQRTGELYDWVGIKPDIIIEPEISDWLEQTDTVLDSVITLIKKSFASK